MELRHLRYFVATAEEQNFSKAAARLHMAQPPLSRQIRDLEDELGVWLFDRTGKSIRLTEAGTVFWAEARAILERAEQAVETMKTMGARRHEELHIAYSPSLAADLLPKLLRAFQEERTDVKLVLHDQCSSEIMSSLRAGTVQLALHRKPARLTEGKLVFHELRQLRIVVATAQGHPLAGSPKISLTEALASPLIAFSKDEYPEYHTWLRSLAKGCGVVPNIAEEHEGTNSVIAAVEAGRGIALVGETFQLLAGNRLCFCQLCPEPAPFHVGILIPKLSTHPLAARFVQLACSSVL